MALMNRPEKCVSEKKHRMEKKVVAFQTQRLFPTFVMAMNREFMLTQISLVIRGTKTISGDNSDEKIAREKRKRIRFSM